MSSTMQIDDLEELVAASNEEGLVPSTVKMKIATFLKEQHGGPISVALNTIVIEMNKLMGEAYLFGNFHASRLLKTGVELPQVDRNFYYRCLLSVGKNKCVETTLTAEWVESIRQFDAFRPKHLVEPLVAQPKKGCAKVSVIGRVQLIADLSILMSTMASNHLWMNLESRLSTYIQWKYPNMSKSNQKSIVVALVKAPKAPLDSVFKCFPLPKVFTSRAVEKAQADLATAKASKKADDIASNAMVQKAIETLEQTKANTPTMKKSDIAALNVAIRQAKKITKDANAHLATANHKRVQSAIETLELTKASTAKRITSEVATRNAAIQQAKEIAKELKDVMNLPSAGQFASNAHLTVPLYNKILKETIEAKNAWTMIPEEENGKRKKKFKGKTFTLLPCKSNFTLSYIPISSMTMIQVLKDLKLINIVGDGRDEDKHAIWARFFNLNAIETMTRRFADRIVTDGYGVSILMDKPSCSCCKIETDGGFSKCIEHVEKKPDGSKGWKPNVLVGAVDPGLTDVVTTAYTAGKETHSYSSSRYYQRALIHTSNRRTANWNKDTEELVKNAPSCEMTLVKYICHYLSIIDRMLAHRAHKGYRAMRFLRYVKKKEAIEEIVELVAPKENVVILGFGDWKGPGKTPISRKTCGPIQDIKFALSKRKNVIMEEIDEYGSSKHCSCCHNVLTNMKAERTIQKKQPNGIWKITKQRGHVHKILHCRSSTNGLGGHCGASWDRDINASRNLLVLTQCQIFGIQRPVAFCRKKITTRSPSGANTDFETRLTKDSVMGNLKHLFV